MANILFSHFFLFNNVWSFDLSLSDKPRGIFVVRIGTVDQKSIKWKRQSKNIDKHMSVYVCEREWGGREKSLMQFEYCRQLLYLRRMTNIILYMYSMYMFSLTVESRYWTMTSGSRERIENTQNFICLHNGRDSRKLPLVCSL